MNAEKLRRLQSQVRIGGKGTPRRKKKVMHQSAATDDKKLQSSLKKLSVSTIPGIEEVNIIKDDLTVIHFNNPKAQASLSANTFAVTGHGETKKIVEMLPEILPQLGQDTVMQLRMFANTMSGSQAKTSNIAGSTLENVAEEDEVPMLVNDFEEVAKMDEAKTIKKVAAKPEQELEKNKEGDAPVPLNIAAQIVDAPKDEATAKNTEKVDKKAKKQQNKQSSNGAAKNKPDSTKNENKQQQQKQPKIEKPNKQEINAATPKQIENKSQDKSGIQETDATTLPPGKESVVKANIAQAQQAKPQTQKSTQPDKKTMQQKTKDDRTKNDKKSTLKPELSKEPLNDVKTIQVASVETPKPNELKDTPQKTELLKIETPKEPQNTNAPKTPELSSPHQKDQKSQKVAPKQQQTASPQKSQGDDSAQSKDVKATLPPKVESPQPKVEETKVESPQPKVKETKVESPQQKVEVTKEVLKDQLLQANNLKSQPKHINLPQTLKDASTQPKTDITLKGASPQPPELKAQPQQIVSAIQTKDSMTEPAANDTALSIDQKKQETSKVDMSPQIPLDTKQKQESPKVDSSSSVNIKKDMSPQPSLVAQQISEPQQSKETNANEKGPHQTTSPTDTASLLQKTEMSPSANTEQNINKLKKQTTSDEPKPSENILVAPIAIKSSGDTTAAQFEKKITENKPISEKSEAQTAKGDTNTTYTPSSEQKDGVKNVAQNKNETTPVAKKYDVMPQKADQPIPTAVIEKATVQIDEVIAAAAKEVAKIPATVMQPLDAVPVAATQVSTEVKSSEPPIAMTKKDDTQAKLANAAATKPSNQTAQPKSGKQPNNQKSNQQTKQAPAKTEKPASNAAKQTTAQQKPSAPPTKKSPTSTPPTTPTEGNKPPTPSEPSPLKVKDQKIDNQKKPVNQTAQKQVQTKNTTTKPTNNGPKPSPSSPLSTGPKKTPPPQQAKQATTPKTTTENNAAKSKQTSPAKAEGKPSTKPADEAKPQQNAPIKPVNNNQTQAAPKANS